MHVTRAWRKTCKKQRIVTYFKEDCVDGDPFFVTGLNVLAPKSKVGVMGVVRVASSILLMRMAQSSTGLLHFSQLGSLRTLVTTRGSKKTTTTTNWGCSHCYCSSTCAWLKHFFNFTKMKILHLTFFVFHSTWLKNVRFARLKKWGFFSRNFWKYCQSSDVL